MAAVMAEHEGSQSCSFDLYETDKDSLTFGGISQALTSKSDILLHKKRAPSFLVLLSFTATYLGPQQPALGVVHTDGDCESSS